MTAPGGRALMLNPAQVRLEVGMLRREAREQRSEGETGVKSAVNILQLKKYASFCKKAQMLKPQ